MADLTADMLGSSNSLTRSQAVKQADSRLQERDRYLADVLAQGTHVQMVVPKGAADSAADIRAVISADEVNINRELIERGYGRFRADLGGAEEQAMHGGLGRLFGKYTEEMFFEGGSDQVPPRSRKQLSPRAGENPSSRFSSDPFWDHVLALPTRQRGHLSSARIQSRANQAYRSRFNTS